MYIYLLISSFPEELEISRILKDFRCYLPQFHGQQYRGAGHNGCLTKPTEVLLQEGTLSLGKPSLFG